MFRRMGALSALLLVALLVSCQAAPVATPAPQIVIVTATPAPAEPTATPIIQVVTATPSPINTPAPEPVIEITGLDGSGKTLTMEELMALPAVEGYAGIKSSTGKITPPALYKGVSLAELAKLVGGFDESVAVMVEAEDGYAMTYSYEQISNGAFTMFDPGTGDELQQEQDLTLIIAYAREGQPMDQKSDGTLRSCIVSAQGNQVTDGHWAIKWVRKVIVKPAVAEWTLHLEGAIIEEMDRNTFESGASPSCHLEEWTDADGHVWGGIPLYYLVGRVDDVTSKHEGDAFNDELANQGYTIDIVASDGYKATLDIAQVKRNKGIIVANTMDGEPLGEKDYPLRLVGAELSKKEMVGTIAQIVLSIPLAPSTPEATLATFPTAAPDVAAEPGKAPEMKAGWVHVWGKVTTPTAFDLPMMQQIGLVKLTAEHPKKGPQEYEGVRLNELIAKTAPQAGVSQVLFTAGDGYTVQVPYADIQACEDCLIVLEGEAFNSIMPGLPSSTWGKDIRLIELK